MHAIEFSVVSTNHETTLNERPLMRTAIPELVGVLHYSPLRNALRAYWRAGRAL